MEFSLTGPVEEFTVQQDLEKGNVAIWGRAREGFFRYRISPACDCFGVVVSMEKLPETCQVTAKGLVMVGKRDIRAGGTYDFVEIASDEITQRHILVIEKLSLGSHKAQDWEHICRRRRFSEILPLWHRLGEMVRPQVERLARSFTSV